MYGMPTHGYVVSHACHPQACLRGQKDKAYVPSGLTSAHAWIACMCTRARLLVHYGVPH